MVAMRLKIRFTVFLSCAFLSVAAQQPRVRIAGLEGNAEYVSLIREDEALARSIDSLADLAAGLREKLDEDDGKRKERSAAILRLEGELFAVRNNRSRLSGRINTIEQNWILSNMSSASVRDNVRETSDADGSSSADNMPEYADLVRNARFAASLPKADYAALLKAQRNERTAVRLLSEFAAAYNEAVLLKTEYEAAGTESAADSLMTLFLEKQSDCTVISDSLSSVWSNTFDNKMYIYDLLFDKDGRDDVLSKAEQNRFAMRRNIDRLRGTYASDAVTEYYFQKRCVVDYEIDAAVIAGLNKAADSLRAVRKSLDGLQYKYDKVYIVRRYFLDYEPLQFSTQYVYNAKNPVPECIVYEHGEMYRIKLGEFAAKQPVSKFRGLEPVSYLKAPNGAWRYYAGGYASADEAAKPLQTVRRLGFRNADIAAWIDGAYADNAAELAELKSKTFLVEISGTEALSDDVRNAVLRNTPEANISRAGKNTFVVGSFRSREEADLAVRNIIAADGSLSATIREQGR